MPAAQTAIEHARQSIAIGRDLINRKDYDQEIAETVIARAQEAMHAAYGAMLASLGLPEDSNLVDRGVEVRITDRAGESWVRFYFDIQSQNMRASYDVQLKVSRNSVNRILKKTEQFVSDAERAVAVASLKEHDVVRTICDFESDGYAVKRGMVGTVVSIYRNAEAFAVEFPELEESPAVVTVRSDEIEPAGENSK